MAQPAYICSIFTTMTAFAVSRKANRFAVSCFFFIAGITFASWASRIPDIKAILHLSDAGLGGVLFALPVGSMTSLPLSGWLVAKFGSKRIDHGWRLFLSFNANA